MNQDENMSKTNDEVNETDKDNSVEEQCEESYVTHDNDDEKQSIILEKRMIQLVQFMNQCQ